MRRFQSPLFMSVATAAVIAITAAVVYVYLNRAPAAKTADAKPVASRTSEPKPTSDPKPVTTRTPAPKPTKVPRARATASRTYAWCSAAPSGSFITPDSGYLIYTDEWHSTLPQTVCANTESDWQVTFKAPAGNTAILTYPDVQLNYKSNPPAVSSLNPAATSSFAQTMNASSGTSAEAAYDILMTNGTSVRSEVMIWVDTINRGTFRASTYLGSKTFCGQNWQLWLYRRELIWYLPGNEHAGTVCPVQMLQNLQSRGLLSPKVGLSQFEFGWEIASTGGVPETFQISSYSTQKLPPGN